MANKNKKIGIEFLLESLFFLFFPIAVIPKMVQLGIYIFACVLMISHSRKVKIDTFSMLIFIYLGVYGISIFRRLWIDENIALERIVSTGYLYILWIVATILYLYFLHYDFSFDKLTKAAFINVFVMFMLAVIAILHSKIYGYPKNISIFGSDLFYWEWTSLRFEGFLDYPTLVTAFEILLYPWASMYVRRRFTKRRFLSLAVFTVMGFLPIALCRSRTGYLLYWVPVLILPLMGIVAKIKRKQIKGFVIFCAVVAGLFCIFNLELCITLVEKLLLMREGSQFSRSVIYSETWLKIKEYPFLGYGIKVKSSWDLYPLGSHSSYLGFLFKSGLIGTSILLVALIYKLRDMYRVSVTAKSVYTSWIIISVFCVHAYFALEDMDGVSWLLCMWFAILGIVGNKNFKECSWEQYEDKTNEQQNAICNR
ncbi:MAG: O-antigen ligase family protein [Lachnospiraceae bacterium]|nr:O-antigen ligase family protein [Lachnospiraceae bacterium]